MGTRMVARIVRNTNTARLPQVARNGTREIPRDRILEQPVRSISRYQKVRRNPQSEYRDTDGTLPIAKPTREVLKTSREKTKENGQSRDTKRILPRSEYIVQ